MKSIFRVFYWGASISFMGSIIIGTIGLSAMQLSLTEGHRPAINFSLGSILGEVIYVRLLLVALQWLRKQERVLRIMQWVAVLIVVGLAAGSFWAAFDEEQTQNVLLSGHMHRFFLGLSMRALSPAAIPFWLGWSAVLYNKGIMQHKKGFYNGYLLGIGLGTFVAHCIFIFGGKWAVEQLDAGQDELNFIIGCVFSVTAVIQVWKIFNKKDAAEKLHEIPAEPEQWPNQ
jgi:threonine/homoserine/homoserine lactone efflux protein